MNIEKIIPAYKSIIRGEENLKIHYDKKTKKKQANACFFC
jgi:hypothetical protein